jgi:3-oxoacyl-[acyl-carrier-protein] synthase II
MMAKRRITLQGIGVVGGFGCGVSDLARALSAGPVPPGGFSFPMGDATVTMPAFRAETAPLKDFVPGRTLRRIDHFSRLGLLGSFLALEDAGLPEADRSRLGLIVASGYGATGITFAFLDSFIRDGDICASPTHFANSVHNSAAANISILLGATGPCLTVSQFHMSVPSALSTARLWLAEGRVDRVLFGAIDELSDLICYVWRRQRGNAKADCMSPLSTGRETAVPGEGAAFLLLSGREEERDGYCTLEDAVTGSRPGDDLLSPAPGLMILGADGRMESGKRYAGMAANARIACYTPLYGSMPAGPAFDLAAAALVLKDGRVFPTPCAEFRDFPASVPAGMERMDAPRVSCLTLDDGDGYGLATLGRL